MNPGTWNPRSYCRYGPSPCHFSPRSLRSLVGCGKEKVTTIWVRDEWGWREVTQEPNRRRTVQAGNWHLRFPTFIRSLRRFLAHGVSLSSCLSLVTASLTPSSLRSLLRAPLVSFGSSFVSCSALRARRMVRINNNCMDLYIGLIKPVRKGTKDKFISQ